MSTPAIPRKSQEIGGVADDFTLPDLNGTKRSLSSFLAGKKGGVVVFWSSVCSHCIRYDSYLSNFTQKHPDLVAIAIASRQGETLQQIRDTAEERSISFPLLHDADSELARNWFTEQTPRAFLLDANRTILYRGAIDNYKLPGDVAYVPYLEPAIDEFHSGQPIKRTETASFGCAIRSIYYILPRPL